MSVPTVAPDTVEHSTVQSRSIAKDEQEEDVASDVSRDTELTPASPKSISLKLQQYTDVLVLFVFCGVDSLFFTLFQLPTLCVWRPTPKVPDKLDSSPYQALHNAYAIATVLSYVVLSTNFWSQRQLLYSIERFTGILITASLLCVSIVFFQAAGLVCTLPVFSSLSLVALIEFGLCLTATFAAAMALPLFCLVTPNAPQLLKLGRLVSLVVVTITIVAGSFFGQAIGPSIALSSCALLNAAGAATLCFLRKRPHLIRPVEVARRALNVNPHTTIQTKAKKSTAVLYRLIWVQLANCFLTSLVTYTVFPSLHPFLLHYVAPNGVWHTLNSVGLLFSFFFSTYLGSLLPYSKLVARYFSILAISRLFYIPVYRYFATTVITRMHWLRLFTLHFSFGLSHGIGNGLQYDHVTKMVPGFPDQQKAQFFVGAYNMIGIVFGTVFMNFLMSIRYFTD